MANWIQRFLAAIATHKADASAHHARYTDAEVDAIVAAHAAIAAAHHARYTDAEAQAIADAQIAIHAALATVHQDAPALIAIHAALPTVHQDAPALIATHKGDASAHHAKTGDNEVYGLLLTGTDAGKPAAGIANRFYWATDTKILYRDTGAAWVEAARGESATRLAQLAEKAHGSLTGVTSDQHHPQAHTLASHSTKAHTELTGVTADQHHSRSHDHSLAADGTPIAVAGVPNLPASKITSLRFPVARLPAMTDEKIWKGTGANVEEVDMPTGWAPTGDGGTKVAGVDCEAALKDPAAAMVGLRTLGSGAQQAAAGNHTHTLTHDKQDGDICADDSTATESWHMEQGSVGAYMDWTAFTFNITPTMNTVIHAGAAGSASSEYDQDAIKLRLIIDGVQVAETSYINQGAAYSWTLYGQKSVAAGARTIFVQMHNYVGTPQIIHVSGGVSAGCSKV